MLKATFHSCIYAVIRLDPNNNNTCSDIKLPLLPACYTQFVIKRLCNFHIPAMMVYAF